MLASRSAISRLPSQLLASLILVGFANAKPELATTNVSSWERQDVSYRILSLANADNLYLPPRKCPPCFNCLLPAFICGQYGECDTYNGQCKCPPGWGGIDCLIPQCDSLADGEHRRLREGDNGCECKDGWGGLNCNVCETDEACRGFPLPNDFVLSLDPSDDADHNNMTCYKGGQTVFSNHQMCDVTNRKIMDQLAGRIPRVTFSCDNMDQKCKFQFWVDQGESFYCGLDNCTTNVKVGYDRNTTEYACDQMKCACIPGRFLCGEDGSFDLTDFLAEEITGPASFSCVTGQSCIFSEANMNELIQFFFGDPYITLNCKGGECLHYSMVPGYIRPPKPDNSGWVALSALGALLIVITVSTVLWYAGRDQSNGLGQIRLPEHESAKLMMDHVPAALHFSNLSYTIGSRTILDGITGCVEPGQVLAIMGASGAGKSTFLDILARKRKRGFVSGKTLVNGKAVSDTDFKKVVGFVDQEDTLMSTLTVYETILYSALLRLPRAMNLETKIYRTLETMHELGILSIKNSRIGDSGHRSISGGEKRRVSIACELVTSPSILFLDEPTSGLDAYNAFNVVESLVNLARNYNRTVVFTIHQPRSNISALFDHLVLLAQGKMVYSGEMSRCQEYFQSIGKPCPPGFNIADYLRIKQRFAVDLTMQTEKESRTPERLPPPHPSENDETDLNDEERGFGSGRNVNRSIGSLPSSSDNSPAANEGVTEIQTTIPPVSTTEAGASKTSGYIKRKTSQLLDAVNLRSTTPEGPALPPKLAALVEAYAASHVAEAIRGEIDAFERQGRSEQLLDVAVENVLLRGGRRGASWGTQFRILSGRAFKNLYRDPTLLTTQYLASVALALICGILYHNVGNDIQGFQNRLGVFFFTLALFGFSCLSSLALFANERILFMRERSNGYYSSFTYFSSKILFDILPLRVVPPLFFGAIVYRLVGLVPEVTTFWKFLLILVLFNLTTATAVLFISIVFASQGVASLVGTLVLLFKCISDTSPNSLLFTGLLVNRESLGRISFLNTISFFHAAYEALAVNELRYLQLKQSKYGVELDVPAATILSNFGLQAQAFWWPDTALLGIFFASFTIASWLVLHFYVREKR
ncbi:hypothetical protein BD410DRAFT_806898 [Rickenella mellea]|uniref:ABC transporter domain-containing protein n=1 Tax=Rickenella mellea TaxID=50990 RepID=A0A4Y7PR22_9AGAM|nr:hypothetical protein BD410DRAFT_806898 [Rickenella mellea]